MSSWPRPPPPPGKPGVLNGWPLTYQLSNKCERKHPCTRNKGFLGGGKHTALCRKILAIMQRAHNLTFVFKNILWTFFHQSLAHCYEKFIRPDLEKDLLLKSLASERILMVETPSVIWHPYCPLIVASVLMTNSLSVYVEVWFSTSSTPSVDILIHLPDSRFSDP